MDLEQKKLAASNWFQTLRDKICQEFESIEAEMGSDARFQRKAWNRLDGGGGVISLMKGKVFEKVGVNISTVHGTFSEKFSKEIPGADINPNFWASGISLVAHMQNPHVPAVHMNTRFIVTTKHWFGGGADMTPAFPYDEDTADFHNVFKTICGDSYEKYKNWCDEYFFLPHRNEPRGIGGIFYDYLDTDKWEADFEFTKSVGTAFLDIYPSIVRKRMHQSWNGEERHKLLVKRGRYVEFNLIHDRGTKFGLMTGGNTEAILMSLPPEVRWE